MAGSASAPAEHASDPNTADELGRQLVRFANLLGRAKQHFAHVTRDGVERAAYALLAHLVQHGPERTTALAEAVHSDPSTVSRQVGALVRHGLVRRTADPGDGRACLLVATEEGRRTFDRARRLRNTHIDRLLAGWPEADRRTLVRLLDRLNTDFENYRPGPASDEPGSEQGGVHG